MVWDKTSAVALFGSNKTEISYTKINFSGYYHEFSTVFDIQFLQIYFTAKTKKYFLIPCRIFELYVFFLRICSSEGPFENNKKYEFTNDCCFKEDMLYILICHDAYGDTWNGFLEINQMIYCQNFVGLTFSQILSNFNNVSDFFWTGDFLGSPRITGFL
jgi:hypothetical protein